jgi:hypothetical protein
MADDVRTDQDTAPAPSAEALWGRLVQEKLDLGYSQLDAIDETHAQNPGLWRRAQIEQHRRTQEPPMQRH